MSLPAMIRRWLAMMAFALWVGGFMFYGGAVVPTMGDHMDAMASGAITRRVTDLLNRVGAATLVLWWIEAATLRGTRPGWARGLAVVFLSISSLLLAWLLALHSVMDAVIDGSSMLGFHRLHRLYLLASTAQWAANLGLLASTLVLWRAPTHIDQPLGGAP